MIAWLRDKIRKFLGIGDTADIADHDTSLLVKVRRGEEMVTDHAVAKGTIGLSLIVICGGQRCLIQRYQAIDIERFDKLFNDLCEYTLVDRDGEPIFDPIYDEE